MLAVGVTEGTSIGSSRPVVSLPDLAKFTSWVRSYQGDHAGQQGCQGFHACPTGAGRAEFLVGSPLDPAAIGGDRGGSRPGAASGARSAAVGVSGGDVRALSGLVVATGRG